MGDRSRDLFACQCNSNNQLTQPANEYGWLNDAGNS